MIQQTSTTQQKGYPYPRQRVFGMFLIGVGITMAAASVFGTKQYPNIFIFIIGYALSMIGIMFNKRVLKKFAIGESTPLQKKASNLSLIFISVAVAVIGFTLRGTGDYRLIWMLILIAVGVHFIPFAIVHGKWSLLLGILTIINASIGLYFTNTPFVVFGIVDAAIKLIIGTILFTVTPKCKPEIDT